MKTITLLKSALSIALVSAVIFSCKKKEETTPQQPEPSTTGTTTSGGTTTGAGINKWTVSGITYTGFEGSPVWNGSGTNNGFMGSGSIDSLVAFQVWLYTRTPVSGTYTIMSYLTKLGSTDPKVASINVGLGKKAWYSKDNGGTVTITNNNGEISATVSNVKCTASLLGTGDSVFVSGNLTK